MRGKRISMMRNPAPKIQHHSASGGAEHDALPRSPSDLLCPVSCRARAFSYAPGVPCAHDIHPIV